MRSLCAILFATIFLAATEPMQAKEIIDFNKNWQFQLGNEPKKSWQSVDLPHDWSIKGEFNKNWASCTGFLPAGVGWYKKCFTMKGVSAGNSNAASAIYLYFHGVYKNAEVWVNGTHLGKRPNGYVSFFYEISSLLKPTGENTILVKVDHTDFADSRWYTGSGIYRDVQLIVTSRLHVQPWHLFARPQIEKSGKTGSLQIDVTLTNLDKTPQKVKLLNRLLWQGQEVARSEQNVVIQAGVKEKSVSSTLRLANPKRWDVNSPELYTLETRLKNAEKEDLDTTRTSVGFRSIRFDADHGFFLNGRNLKLQGVCLHHDAGVLGAAVPGAVLSRRLDLLKELGCNAIRTSHNPFSPHFYALCDEKGFLVINEVFDEWELPKKKWVKGWNVGQPSKEGYAKNFTTWWKRDLRDQVLRDRNHPSIILWSIGNEIDYPNDPYTHEKLNTEANPQTWAKFDVKRPHAKRLGEVAKQMVALVKEYDPTRGVTAGLASALVSNEVGYADALDVVGYNYQEFRYARDHQAFPKRILYGSETSKSLQAWQAVVENDYILGQFLWTGMDYLGESASFPSRHSVAGLLDLAGNKKPEYYYRKSLWSTTPTLFLGAENARNAASNKKKGLWQHSKIRPAWNWQKGEPLRVTAYSNCEEVELSINGKSHGKKKVPNISSNQCNRVSWEVPFEAGAARVVGYRHGKKEIETLLRTHGEPSRLVAKQIASKDGVIHVAVSVVDAHGLPVYSATNRITCEVYGPLRLLGMEDSNPHNTELYCDNVQNAYHGKLLLYVQERSQEGVGKIRLTSPGLTGKELTISQQKLDFRESRK